MGGYDLGLTITEPSCAKRTCLGLLGSRAKGSGGLGLGLSKGSSVRPKGTSTSGCVSFEVLVVKAGLKRDTRTESAGGRLLTEGRVTCSEKAASLLRLRGTESASSKSSRLLWLSLAERTESGPGLLLWLLWLLLLLLWLLLLLLLAECTEPCSGGSTSRSKSTSATESRLSGLCCRLGLAEQASGCRRLCRRSKRTRTESSRSGRLTILLIVLQPEFLRRPRACVSDESGGGFPRDEGTEDSRS